MFEYLKRRLSRMDGKVTIDKYPLYYEENGILIEEEENGRRYEVDVDQHNNITRIREII